MKGRGLKAFREAHDPTHVVKPPTEAYERPLAKGAQRFIVTAAQNATPIHKAWWAVLRHMAGILEAEILVIPLRYKNPTSRWVGSQQNAEWWAEEVRPFLWNTRLDLNRNLTVLADFKIQPTASSPLTGAEAFSHASSGIIGHTKLQLRTVASPSSRMAKILTTTGACTVPNYTDSRAGKTGEFHHSLAAVLVELDGPKFHLRHLHFDAKRDGCPDLDRFYFAEGPAAVWHAQALVMGDTHVDAIDPAVERATFGPGGMVETLFPATLVWHDLLDAYSCNPHHGDDPFIAVAKRASGTDNVRAEIRRAIDFVRERTVGRQSVIVPSNHDDMLRRWIVRTDWREDPTNAQFYLETALALVRGAKRTPAGVEYPDPFGYWMAQAKVPGVKVLGRDESVVVDGIELGMHGDRGPNGARGSIRNLRRIGVKSVIGHSHSPGIDEGAYQVGTSTRLRLEYNHGPSSWLNAHCIIHEGGKRQLVFIVDGKWRLG